MSGPFPPTTQLTLEEQRWRDDDAVYDRYVDPDEDAEPATCEHPGCDADGAGFVDDPAVGPLAYCAAHLPPITQPPLTALLQLARSGPDADWALRMISHLLERDAATRLPVDVAPFEEMAPWSEDDR